MGLSAVNAEAKARRLSLGETLRGVPGVIANPRTWPPITTAAGVYATLITFQGLWGVPYLTQVYGLARVDAAGLVLAISIGLLLGSPLVGWLSDRWLGRRRLPMGVFASLYAACWIPLVLPDDMKLPVGFLGPLFFLLGLTSAGLVLVWACVREVNDPLRVGIAISIGNGPIFLAFALFQSLSGVVLDARWTGLAAAGARLYPPSAYRAVFGVSLAVAVAAALSAWLITETRCRNVWRPPPARTSARRQP
jgi:MFS family permease